MEYTLTPFQSFTNHYLLPDIPSIHILDDDSLNLVLSSLDVLELLEASFVCKRWYNAVLYRLSRVQTLYHPGLTRFSRRRIIQAFYKILNCTGGRLERLHISEKRAHAGFEIWKFNFLPNILKKCPNLTLLELELSRASQMQQFQTILDLETIELPYSLKDLIVKWAPNNSVFEDECMTESIAHEKHDKVLALLTESTQLERITLVGSSTTGAFLRDNLIYSRLKHIEITKCPKIDYAFLVKHILTSYHDTLEYFCISVMFCSWISAEGIEPVTQMKTFIASFMFLRNGSYGPLDEFLWLLKLMPNLQHLDLSNPRTAFQAGFLGVGKLVAYCPYIQHLDLSCLADKSYTRIDKLGLLVFLTFLRLDGLRIDFDMFINDVVKKLASLRTLSLCRCRDLSNLHVRHIIASNFSLSQLLLRKNSQLSLSFLENFQDLERSEIVVDLAGCGMSGREILDTGTLPLYLTIKDHNGKLVVRQSDNPLHEHPQQNCSL